MGVRDEFRKIRLAVEDVNSSPSEDGGKIDKELVHYRFAGEGTSSGAVEKRCGTCDMFEAPSSCSLVSGVISAEGLCDKWEPVNTGSGGYTARQVGTPVGPNYMGEPNANKDHEMSGKSYRQIADERLARIDPVIVIGWRELWRAHLEEFSEDAEGRCHTDSGEDGGQFESCGGGGGSSSDGKSSSGGGTKDFTVVGDRLATAKPSGAKEKVGYVPGQGARMGLDLISDPVKVVARQSAVPGFEDLKGATSEAGAKAALETIVQRQTQNIVDYASAVIDANPKTAAAYADWYPFANKYLGELASANGVSKEGAIAAAASLSASASWESNVPWAKFFIENLGEGKGPGSGTGKYQTVDKTWVTAQYTSALAKWTKDNDKAVEAGKVYKTAKPEPTTYVELIGKQIKDLTNQEAAIALRGKHESTGTGKGAEGKMVTQLGEEIHAGFGTKGGGTIPQSTVNMAKAISVIRDPSPASIDLAIGNQNKVRSFYQNLRDPLDKEQQDVTADTHHFGVANGLPWTVSNEFLNGKDVVNTPGNSRTGALGTYPLVVEATRRAADAINQKYGTKYTPDQIQSIVWEHHKNYYPPALRSNKTMQKEVAAARTEYGAAISGKSSGAGKGHHGDIPDPREEMYKAIDAARAKAAGNGKIKAYSRSELAKAYKSGEVL